MYMLYGMVGRGAARRDVCGGRVVVVFALHLNIHLWRRSGSKVNVLYMECRSSGRPSHIRHEKVLEPQRKRIYTDDSAKRKSAWKNAGAAQSRVWIFHMPSVCLHFVKCNLRDTRACAEEHHIKYWWYIV